jgi:hypothetical protein
MDCQRGLPGISIVAVITAKTPGSRWQNSTELVFNVVGRP